MLAQHVQEFLHAHNKPPAGSLYDEMIQDRQVRRSVQEVAAQQQRQLQQQQFTAEQQTIRDMVMQRKEMFHSEPRRRDMRRSISEASPTHPHHSHHHHHRSNSSSDNSENSSGDGMTVMMAPGAGGHYRAPLIYPNACVDHRCSEVLYMLNVARRIQRGCCLGECFGVGYQCRDLVPQSNETRFVFAFSTDKRPFTGPVRFLCTLAILH